MKLTRVLNWLNGWRTDLDGWIVRARRVTDPEELPCEIGFVEEACIAVRTHSDARKLDLAGRRALADGGRDDG